MSGFCDAAHPLQATEHLTLELSVGAVDHGTVATPFAAIPRSAPSGSGAVRRYSGAGPAFATFVRHRRLPLHAERVAVVIAILAGLLVAVLAVWFAAKVFRIGLLIQGKPPSLLTLVRWARMALKPQARCSSGVELAASRPSPSEVSTFPNGCMDRLAMK